MRPEIAKGGGFEGAETLRIPIHLNFVRILGGITKNFWPIRGVMTPISPPWQHPCLVWGDHVTDFMSRALESLYQSPPFHGRESN